jgi:hypothetical protein
MSNGCQSLPRIATPGRPHPAWPGPYGHIQSRCSCAWSPPAASVATLLDEYPQLSEDDIREALKFAAARVHERTVPLDRTA